jgi:acyl carrier protein
MTTSEEIRERVVKVAAEALGLDEHEVTPGASLQGDLGAESIDFLDIAFRLEREFTIKIPRGELFSEAVFQSAAEIVRDGAITDEGLDKLRKLMPFADFSDFGRRRNLNQIGDLFTVDLLSRYVAWKLDARRPSDCCEEELGRAQSPVDLTLSTASSKT